VCGIVPQEIQGKQAKPLFVQEIFKGQGMHKKNSGQLLQED